MVLLKLEVFCGLFWLFDAGLLGILCLLGGFTFAILILWLLLFNLLCVMLFIVVFVYGGLFKCCYCYLVVCFVCCFGYRCFFLCFDGLIV